MVGEDKNIRKRKKAKTKKQKTKTKHKQNTNKQTIKNKINKEHKTRIGSSSHITCYR